MCLEPPLSMMAPSLLHLPSGEFRDSGLQHTGQTHRMAVWACIENMQQRYTVVTLKDVGNLINWIFPDPLSKIIKK